MSSKKKPVLSTCATCSAALLAKDVQRHADFCTKPVELSEVPVAKGDVLKAFNTALENADSFLPPDAIGWEKEHAILMHPQTMELLELLPRHPIKVDICTPGNVAATTIGVVWPCKELPMLRVHVVSSRIPRERLATVRRLTDVRKLSAATFRVVAATVGVGEPVREFVQMYLSNAFVLPTVTCHIRYLGQQVDVVVEEPVDLKMARLNVSGDSPAKGTSDAVFFLDVGCVVQLIGSDKAKEPKSDRASWDSVGGMTSVKQILEDYVLRPSERNLACCSVLIWGLPGSGKTFVLKRLVAVLGSACCYFSCLDKLSERSAVLLASSLATTSTSRLVVVVDVHDVDKDNRKALDALHGLMASGCSVVLAVRSAENLDLGLRVRFPVEVEVSVPTQIERSEILRTTAVEQRLSDEQIVDVAKLTHGFTAGDLQAMFVASRYARGTTSMERIEAARKRMRPTGIRQFILEVPSVTWDDIGGNEELKLEIQQAVIWPQKHAEAFERFGIDPPAGILLYGPPGCSKTLVARALANEAQMNFLAVKGPELFSKWVGDSEKAIRDLFARARQVAPTIVFFDEIDAVGSSRGSETSSGVSDRVLAQLLTELDGLEKQSRVVLLAATNRPDQLDGALLRPGRLDRVIHVGLPCDSTRRAIFEMRTRKTRLADDVTVEQLVALTKGYSGAELVAVCRTAAMFAMREDISAADVHWRHFQQALDVVVPRTEAHLLEVYEAFRLGKTVAV